MIFFVGIEHTDKISFISLVESIIKENPNYTIEFLNHYDTFNYYVYELKGNTEIFEKLKNNKTIKTIDYAK